MDQNQPVQKKETSIDNLEPNISAAFAYLVPFVSGIVFFLLEKKNAFVRFHALQAVFFWAAVCVVSAVVSSLRILLIGILIQPFFNLATVGLWLFLILKAYQNEEYELPYLGKLTRDQLAKSSNKAE